jgi:hypothetical protein
MLAAARLSASPSERSKGVGADKTKISKPRARARPSATTWASAASWQRGKLKAEGGKTTLKVTRAGALLDGWDDAGSRKHGADRLLDALGASLQE